MAKKIWSVARTVAAVSLVLVLVNFVWIFYLQSSNPSPDPFLPVEENSKENFSEKLQLEDNRDTPITISAVCCGNRVNETLVLLKSAIVLSQKFLNFIVFADDAALIEIREKTSNWPDFVHKRMQLDLRPITFPVDSKADEWRKLFKPCASQRLFLPGLLKNVDSLLYMDTDTLFLAPPELVWSHFSRMDDKQMAAVAPEHEDAATGWYNRFARHPYYGNLGVNSGVMLMNLTRMRAFQWEQYVIPIYQEYKTKITWGDQDIINILFHFHPQKLYTYPCHYNYRPDHCTYMSVCKPAEENGAYVLHGNRGSFHNEKQPAFRAVYEAMGKFEFGADLKNELLRPMVAKLQSAANTNCGKINHVFTKVLTNLTNT